jgi:hypothetical protein
MSVFRCPSGQPSDILDLLNGGVGIVIPQLPKQAISVLLPPREGYTGGQLSKSFDPDRWEQIAAQQ